MSVPRDLQPDAALTPELVSILGLMGEQKHQGAVSLIVTEPGQSLMNARVLGPRAQWIVTIEGLPVFDTCHNKTVTVAL
jgi:hypothetical protein